MSTAHTFDQNAEAKFPCTVMQIFTDAGDRMHARLFVLRYSGGVDRVRVVPAVLKMDRIELAPPPPPDFSNVFAVHTLKPQHET